MLWFGFISEEAPGRPKDFCTSRSGPVLLHASSFDMPAEFRNRKLTSTFHTPMRLQTKSQYMGVIDKEHVCKIMEVVLSVELYETYVVTADEQQMSLN